MKLKRADRRTLYRQRRMGAVLLVLTVAGTVLLAKLGGGDATGLLVLGALGVGLLTSRAQLLYNDTDGDRRHG